MKMPPPPRSAHPVVYFRPELVELENRLAPACAILAGDPPAPAGNGNTPVDKGTPQPVLISPVYHLQPILPGTTPGIVPPGVIHGGPVTNPGTPPAGQDGSTDDGGTDDGSWDDGSTDDGSTDDGSNTDDGSTDDGSGWTDDGSDWTDDGSDWNDSGDPSAGDGNTDGGDIPVCYWGGIYNPDIQAGEVSPGMAGGWDNSTDGVVPIYYSMRGGATDDTMNQEPVAIVNPVEPTASPSQANTSTNDQTTIGNAAFAAVKTDFASSIENSATKASDDTNKEVSADVATQANGKIDAKVDLGVSFVAVANALHKSGDKDIGDAGEATFAIETNYES